MSEQKIPITGMIDFSCQKCGKRFGNRYTCPRCGTKIDKEELDKTMTTVQDMLRLSFVKYKDMSRADRTKTRQLSGLKLGQIERLTGILVEQMLGIELGVYAASDEEYAKLDGVFGSGNVHPASRVKEAEERDQQRKLP